MNKITILPADTYVVVNKTIMNDVDRKILTMLYQPIIGHLPISLYFSLWSDLDKTEIMSIEYTHHHLMTNMQLKLEEIEQARKKLEAIGLLKVYLKRGNINHYIYQLYSPLSAADFLNDPILNVLLYSHLGNNEYNKVLNYFKLPEINLNDYEDITVRFSDIFKTGFDNLKEIEKKEIKKKSSNDLEIEEIVDFDLIISSIPKSLLNKRAFDHKTKELINKLNFLYGIDNLHLLNIIRDCINERGCIDKKKLRVVCRNYYQFEHDDKLPKLIYCDQLNNLKAKKSKSKREEIIHKFETLSPYQFLNAKYNDGTPTNRDKMLLESLLVEQKLNPGVINVLIDYVLKINNNKLNRNFIETIAGQWKRLNVRTVEEAMKQAEKEHKEYKKRISSKTIKINKVEKLPEWFDKEIEEEALSNDEKNKIENMLKDFS